MKNKSLLFVVVTTVILASVFLAILWKTYQGEKTQQAQREQLVTDLDQLVESYKNGKADVIDISSITPFEWEKLYLVQPYSTNDDINKTLGFSANIKTDISYNDGIVLFIFVKENKVVQYMDFHRNPDFNLMIQESGYTPSDAIFVLDSKGMIERKSP